jgi:hypothetical protein
MKRLNIINLDKLRGNKLRQTYRTSVSQPVGLLSANFAVYNVRESIDWIKISSELHTFLNNVDNYYIHFRLYKEITDDGMVMVEKRYGLEKTELFGNPVAAEDWKTYIPISYLQSPDTLCSVLEWCTWDWVGYLDAIQYMRK